MSLWIVVDLGVVFAFGAWLASLISGDTSWVDRLWSVAPIIYVWVFAAGSGLHDARLDVIAVLVTLWGVRLTFNFVRKGGYRGVEDYRWAVLRERMGPRSFQLFNLTFIAVYQNALLVLITLPAWTVLQHRATHFGAWDVLLAVLFVGCTAGETVADEQQWRFQQDKSRRAAHGELVHRRYLREGLFRYSRHPNYFFELTQWWLIFLMAVVAARSWWQWTVVGPVLLTLLFVGSTSFTESISRGRYPEYADYQRVTSAIIPWRPRTATTSEGGRNELKRGD